MTEQELIKAVDTFFKESDLPKAEMTEALFNVYMHIEGVLARLGLDFHD